MNQIRSAVFFVPHEEDDRASCNARFLRSAGQRLFSRIEPADGAEFDVRVVHFPKHFPISLLRSPRIDGRSKTSSCLTRIIHKPFVVTAFMRSMAVSATPDPMNRVTTNPYE